MNFYNRDECLKEILKDHLDTDFFQWADEELSQFGELCGTVIDERARHTDREGQPQLIKYDKFGEDQSFIWLNEGYKQTVKDTYGRGIVGYLYKDIPELGRKGNYLYSFAQGYLLSQTEPGFYCPVTLTMATAYLIERYADVELKEKYLPHVASTGDVDLYEGATFLTERQGGSDVGANETQAIYENGVYRLYGEKYFASNAGACGVATVLARTEGAEAGTKGLSLFLVPWRKDDGSLNGITIRRLKDKLGVRAVPSAEVVFDGARAYMIGEKERGFYYMMEALNLSRICNAVASIGIMRRALVESFQYASNRSAFGHSLLQYPMVQDSLVKMAVKLEAEMHAIFELIALYDQWIQDGEKEKEALLRLLIALLKAESANEAIHFSHEAIEMHGGNGYIEDFVTPRLLRDAQVLTVWEGTANILGLEVLRLFEKYRMDDRFVEILEKRFQQIDLEDKWVVTVGECFIKMKQELLAFKGLNPHEKTRKVKRIKKKLTTLLEAIVLLERVANKPAGSTGNQGQNRRKNIAKIYCLDQLFPLWGLTEETWSLEEGSNVLSSL